MHVKEWVQLDAFDWLFPVGHRVFYNSWSSSFERVGLLMSSSFLVTCPLVIHLSLLVDGAPPLSTVAVVTGHRSDRPSVAL